ncbi:MAG: hypothetical protein ACR2H5_03350 [Ktedonobacteraceae bacterium]
MVDRAPIKSGGPLPVYFALEMMVRHGTSNEESGFADGTPVFHPGYAGSALFTSGLPAFR